MGEPQVPATFERSAPAGSNSLAIPESEVGLPECEIPPGQNYEREKGARLPAQPAGVARELIPLRAFGLFTESFGVRLMNLLSF